MLHLNFGLNFENLADQMMERLRACWVDPMRSPIVIFPDAMLEQWLKLRWMTQNHVLAKLRTIWLDRFLCEALLGHYTEQNYLVSEDLRHILYGWLKYDDNWKKCGGDVADYLRSATKKAANDELNDEPDEVRLYDFSTMMADLFQQYETSRPSGFMKSDGIVRCWRAEESKDFFKKENSEREAWQREIYRKLFDEEKGVVSRLFPKDSAKKSRTLSAVYEACRDENGRVQFQNADEQPVFIFWHAGLGQFYRVAIQEYAKTHEVYAFVQNPCMQFWEDMENARPKFKKDITQMLREDGDEYPADENELLKRWGRAGRDNIKLWCQATDYDFFFREMDGDASIHDDSLLHAIQNAIANRKRPEFSAEFFQDDSLSLLAAPSMIREIEAVHSQISHLLIDKKVKLRDILVVAPDINLYRTAIYQVFDQGGRGDQADHAATLHIPFTIIDVASKESLVFRALKSLFSIAQQGTLSRSDFFDLIRNPVVQNARQISNEDVDAWRAWIVNMNVYRDRKVYQKQKNDRHWEHTDSWTEDWKNGVDRLILAQLSSDKLDRNGTVLLPYSDFESRNADSLNRFVNCIESLNALCQKAQQGLNREDLKGWFIPFLSQWLSMSNAPKKMDSERQIYQNILRCLERIQFQYDIGLERISWKYLEQAICSAAGNAKFSMGTIFVNGVTFMSFTLSRIVPVKHLFFLGMDASSFPGRNVQNLLDLRTTAPWPGDVIPISRNQYAFLSQLMSTQEGFHLSYVNKNLKNDEDFFPSSVICDLREFIGKGENKKFLWQETAISIDENRPWDDLFTGREFRNRALYEALLNKSEAHDARNAEEKKENEPQRFHDMEMTYPECVSIYQCVKYLKDPFQFGVDQILNEDSDEIELEKVQYEPLDLDARRRCEWVQSLALLELREHRSNEDETWIKELQEEGVLPDGIYADVLLNDVKKCKDALKSQLSVRDLTNLVVDRKVELPMVLNLNDGKIQKWTLTGSLQMHERNEMSVIGMSLAKKADKLSQWIQIYVTALVLLVERGFENRGCQDQTENLTLSLCCAAGERRDLTITLSPSEAEKILNQMYRYAFVEQHLEAAPLDLVVLGKDRSGNEKEISTLDAFIGKIEDEKNGVWRYFKKGKLFNKSRDLGYSEAQFGEEWKEVRNRQLSLIQALKTAFEQ